MFNGSGCSGPWQLRRRARMRLLGDCSGAMASEGDAGGVLMAAFSSQPQPLLPPALTPPPTPSHPSHPPMGASPISTSILPNASFLETCPFLEWSVRMFRGQIVVKTRGLCVPSGACFSLRVSFFFRVYGEGAYEPGGRCPPGPPRHCVEPFPCRGLPPAGSFCPCGRLCPLVISSSPLVITRTRRCRGDARTTSGVVRRTFRLGASSDWRTWRPRAHTTSLLTRYSTAFAHVLSLQKRSKNATSTTKSSFPHCVCILWLSLFFFLIKVAPNL